MPYSEQDINDFWHNNTTKNDGPPKQKM